MDVTRAHQSIRLGAMDVTKPSEFNGFGAKPFPKSPGAKPGAANLGGGVLPGASGRPTVRSTSGSNESDLASGNTIKFYVYKYIYTAARIQAGTCPKPQTFQGNWPSGPSPGAPREQRDHKNNNKRFLHHSA